MARHLTEHTHADSAAQAVTWEQQFILEHCVQALSPVAGAQSMLPELEAEVELEADVVLELEADVVLELELELLVVAPPQAPEQVPFPVVQPPSVSVVASGFPHFWKQAVGLPGFWAPHSAQQRQLVSPSHAVQSEQQLVLTQVRQAPSADPTVQVPPPEVVLDALDELDDPTPLLDAVVVPLLDELLLPVPMSVPVLVFTLPVVPPIPVPLLPLAPPPPPPAPLAAKRTVPLPPQPAPSPAKPSRSEPTTNPSATFAMTPPGRKRADAAPVETRERVPAAASSVVAMHAPLDCPATRALASHPCGVPPFVPRRSRCSSAPSAPPS